VNDGGFVVEMAALIILLFIGLVFVFVCYGLFKAINWLYRKKSGEKSAKLTNVQTSRNESES
jgi:hypothetical protein